MLMMSKGYITAEIDKLAQYPKYTEVIRMDPPEAAAAPPKKRTRQETAKAHHALPSLEQLRYLEELAEKKIEGIPPKAHEELRGTGQVSADVFNLSDMRQVIRLQEYLQDNGGYELFHTPKNGQCLYASIRRGMQLPEEYRSNHLRFQPVYFVVQNHDFCFKMLQDVLKYEYGHHRISEQEYLSGMRAGTLSDAAIVDYQFPGPFSFIGYLKHILEPNTWRDEGTVTLIGMMWQLPITILTAEDLSQIKVRHRRPLGDAELVVVMAQRCHYFGTCK